MSPAELGPAGSPAPPDPDLLRLEQQQEVSEPTCSHAGPEQVMVEMFRTFGVGTLGTPDPGAQGGGAKFQW